MGRRFLLLFLLDIALIVLTISGVSIALILLSYHLPALSPQLVVVLLVIITILAAEYIGRKPYRYL